MAQKVQFQINQAGIQEVLNSTEVAALIDGIAVQVANNARGQVDDDVPVEVDTYTTDRHVASVAIKHPGGRGMQLKRGALTKAAGMVGLEVKSR
ncbi:hypothetical protein DEU38_13426 [Rhodococcus sp. AG1013]|uniref:hypothetical protein n=1 Tax=Rhodococcus sp. AG1013 TaxID=2183996 RepID=UPI000E0BDDEE|nr:hypothetical protein [Rhodococcus sp. AG1013]RDI13451.1 hypothetical protein DEU38_13426 [Rhodococcus sp. AG1013]